MDVIVEAFRRLDLFAGLAPIHLTEIVRKSDRVTYNEGDTILAAGAECDAAIVIVSGEAISIRESTDGPGEEVVAPGSILAELAMVVDIEASATIVANSRVRAVRITRASMLELFQVEPAIAESFLDQITSRLRNVADHLRLIDAQIDPQQELASPMLVDLRNASAHGLPQQIN